MKIISFFFFVVALESCTLLSVTPPVNTKTEKLLRVQFVSLFNQISKPSSQHSWVGDWIFRRERLELIDKQFYKDQPDVIIFQQLMERGKNDSDKAILGLHSLVNFKWTLAKVAEHEYTGESEYAGIAVGNIQGVSGSELVTREVIRKENYIVFLHKVNQISSKLYIFNIVGLSFISSSEMISIVSEIKKLVKTLKCPKRTIVVGSFSNLKPVTFENYFLPEFKDGFKGFCNTENFCYTSSSRNEIFMSIMGEVSPRRTEFIWINSSQKVAFGETNMDTPSKVKSKYYMRYGLEWLWPTERFGVLVDLLLSPVCQ